MNNLIGISGKIGSGKDTVGKILQYLSTVNNPTKEEFIERHINNNHTLVQPKYQIKKYADKLKDIVCLLTGCTREQLEDREFKESKLSVDWDDSHGIDTYRDLIQVLGTDCGRDIIHPNIWVNALFADYKTFNSFYKSCPKCGHKPGNDLTTCPHHHPIELEYTKTYPNWIITDVRFPNEAKAIKDRGGIVIRVERDYILRDVELPFIKDAQHPSETALDDYEFDHVIDNDGSLDELIGKVKQLKLV